jgi:hypothetical protein
MADDYDDDQETRLSVEDLRALRQAKKERDDLAAQINAQNRELAFARAKIDMDDPRTKYFIKGYDGELTPEAIRAQAEADGFFNQQKRADTSHEVAGQQRIANAAAGGTTNGPDLHEKIKNAQSQEEVMAIMIEAGYPTSWNSQ